MFGIQAFYSHIVKCDNLSLYSSHNGGHTQHQHQEQPGREYEFDLFYIKEI